MPLIVMPSIVMLSIVMPRLDLGISGVTSAGEPNLRRSRNGVFTPGDAKIKSWHDGMPA